MKMKGLRGFRGLRPMVAAVAAVTLGLGVGGVGPAASAAGVQAVSASLAKPVVAASCSGTPTVCEVGVAVGAVGFPVSVPVGATRFIGTAGAVPAGSYVQVQTSGELTPWSGSGPAASDGSFSIPRESDYPGAGQVVTIQWSPVQSLTLTNSGTQGVVDAGGTLDAGALATTDSYSLAASVNYWQVSNVSANANGDLTSIAGAFTGNQPATIAFQVLGVSSGMVTQAEVSVNSGPWSAISVSSDAVTSDGLTFYLDGSSPAVGDQISVQIAPQDTNYMFSADSTTVDHGIYGAISSGDLVSIPFGNGAVTFSPVSVPVYSATFSVTGTSWTYPTTAAATPTAADFTVA